MDFARVLAALQKFLDQGGYRYALAGAFAMHGLGMSRMTNDLDLVVEDRAKADLLRFVSSLGYETLFVSEGFSNHLHAEAALGRVDFIYVDEHTAGLLFDAATPRPVLPGLVTPVPKPEHLAAMKVQAIKDNPKRLHRDLADILFIWDLPGVDREQIRRSFEQHGLLKELNELPRS